MKSMKFNSKKLEDADPFIIVRGGFINNNKGDGSGNASCSGTFKITKTARGTGASGDVNNIIRIGEGKAKKGINYYGKQVERESEV